MLLANPQPHQNRQKNPRNQLPSKIKTKPQQNRRSPFPPPPSNSRKKSNRQQPNRKISRPNLSRDKQRPIITKRKQKTSNNSKQELNKPKLMPPLNKHPAKQLSNSKKDDVSKTQRDKIDLLDRPRSHNPTKDVPLVKYQSIILEEPTESENGDKSRNKSPYKKKENPLKLKSDKESKMPKSSSVNYGYHPIIDFFPQYRFDAAH